MQLSRRTAIAAGLALVASSSFAQAQPYPAKPVTIVVPYAPGGTTDIIARLAAQHLTTAFGVTFNVENKPGASGTLAMAHVAKANPDGYTLLANEITQTVVPALFSKLSFDPVRDIQPITLIAETPVVLGVTNHLAVRNMNELLAYGKSHPGQLNFGSGGAGSGPHIAGELLKQVSGIEIQHVPYKGSGPAVSDLIGGQIQLLASAAPTIAPHVVSGKIKAVAVAGPQRVPLLPDVPTAAEAGLPGFNFSIWFGLAAPRGTPGDIVGKINAELGRMLQRPDIREKLSSAGAYPVGAGPAEFASRIQSETRRWSDLIIKTGLKLD